MRPEECIRSKVIQASINEKDPERPIRVSGATDTQEAAAG
jgi:hypothetical protein